MLPLLLIIVFLCGSAAQVHGQRPIQQLFYFYDTPAAWESLTAYVDQISIIAPGRFEVAANGRVSGAVDARLLQFAREQGVAVMPLVVNPGFDQRTLHRFLENPRARRRAIGEILDLCRRNGFAGVQIDFENLSIDDRDAFTRFFRELAAVLRPAGFQLSAAVVHRPSDDPGPTPYHQWLFRNWRAGYDLAALGETADFLSLMSYNQHTRRTPPGPQHGMPWLREVVEYALRHVPPEKLSMGIITNSMHWFTSQEDGIVPEMARSYSRLLDHRSAIGLAEENGARWYWAEEQATAFTYFAVGGTFEWIWLEDARSFSPRLDLVEEYGLRGFSIWALGEEDPAVWTLLRSRSDR